MAETLGSLVDKLTIKSIREYHIQEMLDQKDTKFTAEELQEKLDLLRKQKQDAIVEINAYVGSALENPDMILRDEKIKLYNARNIIGDIGNVSGLAEAIDGLAQKNLELWHLEDEARRTDVSLEYIGEIKKKIDPTNQRRNDFIDKIDEIFSAAVKSKGSHA